MIEFDERFTVEESRALLFYIWPEWPGYRGIRACPDLRGFLTEFRRRALAAADKQSGDRRDDPARKIAGDLTPPPGPVRAIPA